MTELRTPHLLHVLPTPRTANLIAGFGSEFRHSILSMDAQSPKAGSFTTVRRMRELLRREAPDLVLTYNWGAFDMLLAARSLRFRRVVHHEDSFTEAETFKRILARRALLPGVHRLIVPSERLLGIATRLWKVPAGQITLIRDDIPFESLRDAYREVYHSALCAGSEPALTEAFDALC
jgi:L-malate glycosyltransferase